MWRRVQTQWSACSARAHAPFQDTGLHRQTGLSRLCLAGGVALNSVANGRILRETPFEELYVQPSAGDGGGALGAALYAWHCALGNSQRFVMDHAYWGQSYTMDEIRAALADTGMKARYIEDKSHLVEMTVDRLLAGEVVGWFQGRFEWGPRALGNRSILADPRRPDIDASRDARAPRAPLRAIQPEGRSAPLPVPARSCPASGGSIRRRSARSASGRRPCASPSNECRALYPCCVDGKGGLFCAR
jgi:hypothetical protein